MLLERNKIEEKEPYWHFKKFCRQGEWELNRFPSIPEMAHYFDDPSVLVFDTRKELRVNVDHIIADNKDRFPDDLKSMQDFGLQNLGSGPINLIGMAELLFVKSKENPAERVGIPLKGVDVGVCK